jgi:chemotaxis protein MotB
MHIRSLPPLICITVILLSGCTSMPLLTGGRSELEETQKELEMLRAALKQTEIKLQWTELELSNSESARRQLSKELKKVETQTAYLKNINRQQQKNIKTLRLELQKRRSIIQLQGQVIGLLDDTKKTIETSLKDQIAAQEIEVVEVDDKLKVIFVDKILFDSGSVAIKPRGKELLMIMADSLKGNEDQEILVEGHTDNVPLSAALQRRFPSNWELSTARAAAVAHFFQQEGGITPERLSARGYSFYRPVASNETEDGRHQNRRIEIILGPNQPVNYSTRSEVRTTIE